MAKKTKTKSVDRRNFLKTAAASAALAVTKPGVAGAQQHREVAGGSVDQEVGPGVGEPGAGGPIDGGSVALTSMAFTTAAGTSLFTLGLAAFIHGQPGARRAIGLVLVTQAVLLFRIGIAGPALELEEIARAALLVVAGATGAALARAAATSRPARVGDDEDSDTEVAPAGMGCREVVPR